MNLQKEPSKNKKPNNKSKSRSRTVSEASINEKLNNICSTTNTNTNTNNTDLETFEDTEEMTNEETGLNSKENLIEGEINTYDDFEKNILNINLKKRSALQIFHSEIYEREFFNSNKKFKEIVDIITNKWAKMSDNEKEEFKKKAEKEKTEFNKNLKLISKYLIRKLPEKNSTGYSLFIEKYFRDIKVEKNQKNMEEANNIWKNMTKSEKSFWEGQTKTAKEAHQILKSQKYDNINNINQYSLFVKDQFILASEQGNTITFKECSLRWKSTSEVIKEKYINLANELRKELFQNKDIFEVTFAKPPKQTYNINPFNIFQKEITEMYKKGNKKLNEGEIKEIWKEMSDDEKHPYYITAKKNQLIQKIKKIENSRKIASEKKKVIVLPSQLYINENKRKSNGKDDCKNINSKDSYEDLINTWNSEEEKIKKDYCKKAQKLNKERIQAIEEKENNRVYHFPKRPNNGYQIFFAQNYAKIKQKHKVSLDHNTIFLRVVEKWRKLETKSYWDQLAHKNREIYNIQKKEYEKFGYYNLDVTSDSERKRKSKENENEEKPVVADEENNERSKTKSQRIKKRAK